MKAAFLDLMKEATQRTRAGRLDEATAVIQRALQAAGLSGGAPRSANTWYDPTSAPPRLDGPGSFVGFDPDTVIEAETGADAREGIHGWHDGSHREGRLSRQYRLFVPASALAKAAPPLVVMLHGCTQTPDDFAAGTDMNRLAIEHGFCVLYPAQAQDANPSRCWNWFKHNHQTRGRGEAAVIAEMTRRIVDAHGIDPRRVYIAGLSAGGAMAAIVGAAYPERFAAVGVHSGLAPGSARNLPEALAAMRGARQHMPASRLDPGAPAVAPHIDPIALPLPLIVFHGDADRTVHVDNADALVNAALSAIEADPGASSRPAATERGTSAGGRAYTRSLHRRDNGTVAIEQWLLHGGSHAWSGGSSSGSYTDPIGPDASAEMIRFFLERPEPERSSRPDTVD